MKFCRVPTKWEQYAASKGINKTKNAKGANAKNPRLVWDDATQEWIPGYGYKKVKADNVKNWMMHVKGGSDPMEVKTNFKQNKNGFSKATQRCSQSR